MEETLYLLNSNVNAQQLKNGENLVEVNIIFRSTIKRLRFTPKNSSNKMQYCIKYVHVLKYMYSNN